MNWPHIRKHSVIRRRPTWRPDLEQVEGRQLLSTVSSFFPVRDTLKVVPGTFQSLDGVGQANNVHHSKAPGPLATLRQANVVKKHGSPISKVGQVGANVRAETSLVARAVAKPASSNVTPATTYSSAPPYTPAQIKKAYGFDQVSYFPLKSLGFPYSYYPIPADGSGQTIAIVDAYNDPNIYSDANTFDQTFAVNQYGASSKWLTVASPQGTPATANAKWSGEIALDVEWAHAIAPGEDPARRGQLGQLD